MNKKKKISDFHIQDATSCVLLKKFPVFYGTGGEGTITTFARALHLSVSSSI
jgi:hypothetical protein